MQWSQWSGGTISSGVTVVITAEGGHEVGRSAEVGGLPARQALTTFLRTYR